MNKQLTIANKATNAAAAAAASTRFNLHSLGLSDAQLKSIAGARPCEKTCVPTKAPITTCCWG